MDSKVSALDTIPAIDRAADFLYIVDTSAGSSNKVTPNGMLGITGAPVGTDDTQTLANKTISGANNTITDIDPANVTGLPAVASIVTLTGTQTLTNKTLTSPTINTATITNPTLTVDSISGFTSPDDGNIYGIAISGGAIQSSSALAPGIVVPNTLQPGTGATWISQPWTPTWTAASGSPTIGNGVYETTYMVIGKFVFCRFSVTFGSTTNFGGASNWFFTLPVPARTSGYNANQPLGYWRCVAGATSNHGTFEFETANTVQIAQFAVSGSNIAVASVNATSPGTWANGSFISGTFIYEAE